MARQETALLLIDYINPFHFVGADRLAPRAIRAARHTARLKARAKADGMPVIYVNDNFGNWRSEFSALTRRCMSKTGAASVVAELLHPDIDDLAVLKPRHSGFYGTPLAFLLDELKISRLVLTGVATDICVFATAQDAYVRQFELWIPGDCVAAETAAYDRTSLVHMERALKADIRPAHGARKL